MLRWFGILAVVLLVAGFAAQQVWMDVTPGSVEVAVPKGASSAAIGRLLKREGIIRSAIAFRLLARLSGQAEKLQSGEYRFSEPADLLQVMDRLQRGDTIMYRVTVPEGLRVDEVLALLARETGVAEPEWKAALASLTKGQEVEGRLLPETYTYRRPADPKRLLAQMLEAHDAVVHSLLPSWLDADQLSIVASIIEKETAVAAERPLVAAVIRNRLQKHMALQMDSTVIYGLWREDGSFSGNLHKSDMERDTPWNSYVHKGLPPTPICNPGKASLEAAAHPADVKYLYFVANGTGGHAFASTLAEHDRNVRKWIKMDRQRQ